MSTSYVNEFCVNKFCQQIMCQHIMLTNSVNKLCQQTLHHGNMCQQIMSTHSMSTNYVMKLCRQCMCQQIMSTYVNKSCQLIMSTNYVYILCQQVAQCSPQSSPERIPQQPEAAQAAQATQESSPAILKHMQTYTLMHVVAEPSLHNCEWHGGSRHIADRRATIQSISLNPRIM